MAASNVWLHWLHWIDCGRPWTMVARQLAVWWLNTTAHTHTAAADWFVVLPIDKAGL